MSNLALVERARILGGIVALLPALACGCSGTATGVGGSSGTSGSTSSSGGSSSGETPPPETPPAVAFAGATAGCGDVFLYRASTDGTQFFTVQIDRSKLGIAHGAKRTFDLATARDGVRVGVDIYARAPKEPRYCSDYQSETIASTPWTAESGTLLVEVGEEESDGSGTFRATIHIQGLRLVGPERGTSVIVPKIDIENVLVGWFAG